MSNDVFVADGVTAGVALGTESVDVSSCEALLCVAGANAGTIAGASAGPVQNDNNSDLIGSLVAKSLMAGGGPALGVQQVAQSSRRDIAVYLMTLY